MDKETKRQILVVILQLTVIPAFYYWLFNGMFGIAVWLIVCAIKESADKIVKTLQESK